MFDRLLIFHFSPFILGHEANQDEALGDGDRKGNRSLTSRTFQTGQDIRPMLDQRRESGILVPPVKLRMTYSIILMALLIFIASFSLFLFLLVILAKRRRQIRQMILTNKNKQQDEEGSESNLQEQPSNTFSLQNPNPPTSITTRPSSSPLYLGSSTIEKCATTIFFTGSYRRNSQDNTKKQQQQPLYSMGKDLLTFSLGSLYPKNGVAGSRSSGDTASCFELPSSEDTTFTVISNQNDFPPPPTSIISTASTSHGYGSIEEDEDEDLSRY